MPTPSKAALRARVRAARAARTRGQRAADAEALARVVLASPLLAGARTVALYASTPAEPGTGPLRAALAARGVRVLLPVVTGDGPLAWVEDTGPAAPVDDALSARAALDDAALDDAASAGTRRPGAHPIGTGTPRANPGAAPRAPEPRAPEPRAPEPRAPEPRAAAPSTPTLLGQADVVLLPALAVDGLGHRLGQGGGHYDRTLAGRPLPRGVPLVALVHDDELLPAGAVPAEPHDVPVDAVATPRRFVVLRPR